jgi:hypothetical protein
MAEAERHEQSLVEECSSVLDECRMVLPGIQALVGFQFVAVFNHGFRAALSYGERCAHLAAVVMVVMAAGLVMAPAAYQRQAEPHVVSRHFVSLASRLIAIGMALLGAGLVTDLYLLARAITTSPLAATTVAAVCGVALGALWFAFPLARRRTRD